MKKIEKHWDKYPNITPEAEVDLHRYPPIIRQILFNHGCATHEAARRYFEAIPPANTDPFNMLGIPEAAQRIEHALRRGERITIYGDYDVDGVTSTALLYLYLTNLGANVTAYIPDRFKEGYGLKNKALTSIRESGTDLVITVDCGIRSHKEVEFAREMGLDIIISDHHHPGDTLPDAMAVIDPKQSGEKYPEIDLAGVGVAFKLASALDKQLENTKSTAEEYLDLVALGTVADLAPLKGENRSLVRRGIYQLQNTQRQGLMSLMGVAGVHPARITARDIGFSLGPRLNAAGRLEHAKIALDLLITYDLDEATILSQQLEIHNYKRQKITREIQSKAEELALSADPDALLLFAVDKDFSLGKDDIVASEMIDQKNNLPFVGVVGLAASRLTDQFYRPAIVGEIGDEYTRASCRSIPEFHITEALDQCADLLEHHGGHAAAAGFTVKNENLLELSDRLKSLAYEKLSNKDLKPTLLADKEIPLSDLTPDLLKFLKRMQPTGYGNPQALFVSRNLKPSNFRTVGRDNSHLKISVSDGNNIFFDGIAFRLGEWANHMPQRIDLLYHFEMNEFNGRKTLQLNIQDIRASE